MPGQEGAYGTTMDGGYNCGYCLAVLLFLFQRFPSSYSAHVAFPNDVLASLGKLQDHLYENHKHDPRNVLPTPDISSAKSYVPRNLSPVEAALTKHGYNNEKFNDETLESWAEEVPRLPSTANPEEGVHNRDSVGDIDRGGHFSYQQSRHEEHHSKSDTRLTQEDHSRGLEKPEASPTDHGHLGASEQEDYEKTHSHGHESVPEKTMMYNPDQGKSVADVEHKAGHHSKDAGSETKQSCPQCQLRSDERAYRIKVLKQKILDKLHIITMPNRTRRFLPKALAYMKDIDSDILSDSPYGGVEHTYNDDGEDPEYSAPERVFTSAKPLEDRRRAVPDTDGCFFSLEDGVFRSRINEAYLLFYVRPATKPQSPVLEIKVNRLGPHGKIRSAKHAIWNHKEDQEKAEGWKRVDVTTIVRRWAKHPSSNFGLEIVALNGEENLAVLPSAGPLYAGYEPTLDIKISNGIKRRSRRSDSLVCSENSTEHRCCRYPLTVSFAEFGWEWVIAPTHVKADYCSGECRMTLQNKTPHSWIASQTPQVTSQGGGACCTPSEMSSLPLLYFDGQGNVVFQKLQNMRVERCGCA